MKILNFKKIILCLLVVGVWNVHIYEPVQAQHLYINKDVRQTDSIIFAAIGDYGLAGQSEADVAALVKSWKPDFIVTLGDNNYEKGSAESIDQNIGQYYHEYIYPYRGKYGSGSITKKFFPVLGNHDWESGDANPYFNYFSFYSKKGYYEFVQGPVHFFMLDSDSREPDGISSTSKQAKWLQNAMAASTSSFKVVVLHHAPYSSGAHGSTVHLQWPFKDWGADVVLAGHDHIYERLLVNGLPYFVNGIGGAELYKYGNILPESQIRFNGDLGAMRVEVAGSIMKFQMFTRTGVLVDQYTISKTIPAASSITRVDPALTNAASVDYSVNFSEAVTGVDGTDFSLQTANINDASIMNVTGSGRSYIVSVHTGSTSGTLLLKLNDDNSILGLTGNPLGGAGAGNGNFISNDLYTTDKTQPVIISVTRVHASPTNALSVDYAISFSEPVNGVDTTDFLLFSSNMSGALISNVTGSGMLYTVTINTGVGDTTLQLTTVNDGTIRDVAGNSTDGNFTNGEIYNIVKNTPMVTSIIRTGAALTNVTSMDFIVTFSELVSGLDPSDFALTTDGVSNASISNITNSNPFYVVTVNSGSGNGNIRLDLMDNDTIINSFGTPLGNTGIGNGNFSNGESYLVDKIAPIVTSIQRASQNPTTAASVDFIVTFSEKVTGVDPSDFFSSTTNISDSSLSTIVDASPFYVVSVTTGSGTGSLRLDLADNDSIMDAAGNLLGSLGNGNGNFVSGDSFTVIRESVHFPAPILLDPRRNLLTNNVLPSFSWTIVRNARAYEIVIALDENFQQTVIRQMMDRPAYVPAAPFQDGVYFWKVRAYNSDLLPGKFSSTQIFVVDKTPPAPPTVTNPINGASIPKRSWLQWTASSDVKRFQIEVDNRSDFLTPEFRASSNQAYIRLGNVSRGVYFWRIKGMDSAGNWGAWSSTYSFTIQY